MKGEWGSPVSTITIKVKEQAGPVSGYCAECTRRLRLRLGFADRGLAMPL